MSQEPAHQEEDAGRWKRLHIDPTISIGHIITTISIAVSMIWWASTVETRLGNHDVKIQHMQAQDERLDRERERERREWKDELREIKAELRELNTRLGNGGLPPPSAGPRAAR